MIAVFLVALILGLLLVVRAMLFGVERDSASVSVAYPDPSRRPTIRYWLPVFAAFLTVFGLVGYLLARPAGFGAGPSALLALVAGALAAGGVVHAVGRAVAFVPEHDPDDPRYVLQGHVAQVTAAIRGDDEGEIMYAVGAGETRRARARGIDGASAEAGSDVVIDRIEDGVAYVEPWVTVEKRL